MKKLLILTLFCVYSAMSYAQDANRQFCNSIKEHIINNNYSDIEQYLNKEFDKDSMKIYIEEFSNEINSKSYKYNEHIIAESIDGIMTITGYGYRWANSQNISQFIIQVKCKIVDSKDVINEVDFISYNKKLPSMNFPNGKINKSEIAPAIPPPPPPHKY